MRHYVRWMIRRDMDQVLALESKHNPVGMWGEENFLASLRQRNCIGMVVEQGEDVVGFMVYELHPHKLELVRFAADEAIAALLLTKLKSKLSSHRRDRIGFNVWEGDLTLLLALKANGFEAVRVEKGVIEMGDVEEDAYRMVWRLTLPPLRHEIEEYANSGSP